MLVYLTNVDTNKHVFFVSATSADVDSTQYTHGVSPSDLRKQWISTEMSVSEARKCKHLNTVVQRSISAD